MTSAGALNGTDGVASLRIDAALMLWLMKSANDR